MPGLCRHIGALVLGLMVTLNINSQEISDNMNAYKSLMNQYELICGECLEMKHLVGNGSGISRHEAQRLLNEFISLNKKIKAIQSDLPNDLNLKFIRINQWFATGKRPAALDDNLNTPKIENSPRMTCRPIAEHTIDYTTKPNKTVSPTKQNTRKALKHKVFILVNISAPVSYGLRAGFLIGKWGGYISGRSNFSKCDYSYLCTSNNTMENGLSFWGTGRARRNNMSAHAGIVFGATKWLDIYAGAGYGYRNMYFEDIEGKWARVSDLSHKGVAAEVGVIVSWRRLSISAGISSVKFRTASADFGIGINF